MLPSKVGDTVFTTYHGSLSVGTKANNIVIDSDITNQEIIHCVLRPTLIPLMLVPPKWAMKLFRIKPYRVKRFKRNEYIVDI